MKRILNESRRNEKGQALIIVLGLLAIGGLTITPVLAHMSTGLSAGQGYRQKMELDYAADAGVEDALWKAQNEELPFEPGDYGASFNYTLLEDINGKAVSVNITQIWPLTGLESDEHGITPPSCLTITGGIVNRVEGKYKVQISYDGTEGSLPIDKIAVWLPPRFEYVPDSSIGITDHSDVPDNPDIDYQRGGKVMSWNFTQPVNFAALPTVAMGLGFKPGAEYPATRKLYFNVTPVEDVAGGSYSWVRTTNTDVYLAWETGCTIYETSSTATDNATRRSVTLGGHTYFSEGGGLGEGGFQVRGSCKAIGNSLMEDTNGDWSGIRDILLEESSATIPEEDLPDDAEVVMAYLYWSAWWSDNASDAEVTFQIDSDNATTVTASRWSILPAADNYSYACFADVTSLVSEIEGDSEHSFTVGGVSGRVGEHWSYAGWSLVIFYSSPSELAHQFFLYDQFLYADDDYDEHTFYIEGFYAPLDAEAFLTCFVGEGDDCWNGDYIEFNDYRLPADDPDYDVWDGYSSGLGGEEIDGVDIDTFNVSSPIIEWKDTSAEVFLHTNWDAWNLVYILLAFRSEYGGLTPNATGIISYKYGP